ncbi:MAG: UDP-glucose 4-epimerase GalE [Phycisphaerales bacterium]|jgi:UDP-glucose 4-epimerase|nr:UDP-glucose 4-epimerase GalE [Phycisphaerales bacterium]
MRVLVTGGAGYIGSHASLRLLEDGHEIISIDNLSRGHAQAEAVLAGIAGDRYTAVHCDLHETDRLTKLLLSHRVDVLMHFAALAEVGESVDHPLRYHYNNIAGTVSLLQAVDAAGTSRVVLSSSCSTYGEPEAGQIPISEDTPQNPISPYGDSKLQCERMLRDLAEAYRQADRPFSYVALRYFNVAGCDRQTRLGEDHRPETHLIPICLHTALGKRDKMAIFGTDYPTPDGTCIRDYVHVEDLADAHARAMGVLEPGDEQCYNVGIGKGFSVRECIESSKRVSGIDFQVDDAERRPGDPPELYADVSKIERDLGWKASITDIDETVESAWKWFKSHPDGWPED